MRGAVFLSTFVVAELLFLVRCRGPGLCCLCVHRLSVGGVLVVVCTWPVSMSGGGSLGWKSPAHTAVLPLNGPHIDSLRSTGCEHVAIRESCRCLLTKT